MDNPLVDLVEQEFKQIGFLGAQLLHQSFHPESFGNAIAVYQLENMHLQFLRERSDDTIDFLNPNKHQQLYTFDDMSLLLGWTNLEALVRHVNEMDFSKPPEGCIPLHDALGLIFKHYDQLQDMYSSSKLSSTLKRLENTSKVRCKAVFG